MNADKIREHLDKIQNTVQDTIKDIHAELPEADLKDEKLPKADYPVDWRLG